MFGALFVKLARTRHPLAPPARLLAAWGAARLVYSGAWDPIGEALAVDPVQHGWL